MEKSIFNESDYAHLMERISSLKDSNQPLWGTMNVSQMLVHCSLPLQGGLNEIQVSRSIFGFLFGRKFLTSTLKNSSAGFKKNLPTEKKFKIEETPDFEKSKQDLISTLTRFYEVKEEKLTAKAHPFFGKMNKDEWGRIQYIHLNHHLSQFGV